MTLVHNRMCNVHNIIASIIVYLILQLMQSHDKLQISQHSHFIKPLVPSSYKTNGENNKECRHLLLFSP